jgi:phage tail tape-measure protein
MHGIKHLALVLAASLPLAACASDDYGYRSNAGVERAATGAAIGAAAGAAVGAAVEGVRPVEGAVVGAIAGGAIAAATDRNRRWYRDDRGDCYYIDKWGVRRYDYDRRC